MAHNLKTPGIIRAGFEYQDLVAIDTLLDYYRNPERYQWVQVESTDPAFKAVDDVVACLADGKFEVTQVKFAADPDNENTSLNWNWLLTHKARGKSLLRHWSDAVGPLVVSGQLAAARLPDILPADLCEICTDKSGLVVSLSQQLTPRQKLEVLTAESPITKLSRQY